MDWYFVAHRSEIGLSGAAVVDIQEIAFSITKLYSHRW